MTPESSGEMSSDDLLTRAIHTWREPIAVTADFDDRLLARLHAEARTLRPGIAPPRHPSSTRRAWSWLTEARPIRVRPVTIVAGGAVAAAILVFAWSGIRPAVRDRAPSNGSPTTVIMSSVTAPSIATPLPPTAVRFVLVAPNAHQVSVLGDFNHWDATATPLARTGHDGNTWATTVRLDAGRHVYAFVVDGARWVTDPTAPRSLDDDFGRPAAVLTVLAGRT